jgi:hypothetical protein
MTKVPNHAAFKRMRIAASNNGHYDARSFDMAILNLGKLNQLGSLHAVWCKAKIGLLIAPNGTA